MSYQKTVGALCAADTKQVGNQYVSQDKLIVQWYSKILRGGYRWYTGCQLLQGYRLPEWQRTGGSLHG